MCTLSYIPLKENDFIFTTNRDEKPERCALFPDHYEINGCVALFPKDEAASGTWMLNHEKDYAICLLNGAFVKHQHQPPYRKSRGLVVLEFAKYKSVVDFASTYDFKDIEPFTVVVLSYKEKRQIEEIRWDGGAVHYRKLDESVSNIWSSATLYNKEISTSRREWFEEWKLKGEFTSDSVLDFHKGAGNGDLANGLIMNRQNMIRTTSITQVRKSGDSISMYYEDLQKNKSKEINMK